MKYLWTVGTTKIEVVDGEKKETEKYYEVVASNVLIALEYMTKENGIDLADIDYVRRKNDVPVAD